MVSRASLTESAIAAILASLSVSDSLTWIEFEQAIANVAAAVIEEEAAATAALLSLTVEYNAAAYAQEWISMMPERMKSIRDTTIRQVQEVLIDSLNAGDSIQTTATKIRKLFDQMSEGRALVIAQTEVLGATNFAAFKIFQLVGVPLKRWVGILDEKIRSTHASIHGAVQQLLEPFLVGDSLMQYPGDPEGAAKEVINCRCRILPEYARSVWSYGHLKSWQHWSKVRSDHFDAVMLEVVAEQFQKQSAKVVSILQQFGA